MHIFWHGLSCVKLQTQDGIIVINPFQDSGITMPKLKCDIVASTDPSNDQTNNLTRLQGDPTKLTNPGEYELSNIYVYGVPRGKGKSFFVFNAEGITIGHLGTEPKELTNAQLATLESVDILFLPVSGATGKQLSAIVSQIEPRIIIPIQYASTGVKAELDPLDAFAKEFGVKDTDGEAKVIIKKKDLPIDETKVIILAAA